MTQQTQKAQDKRFECWTCARPCELPDPDCCIYCESGVGHSVKIGGEWRHVVDMEREDIYPHRAAGHDVREVTYDAE